MFFNVSSRGLLGSGIALAVLFICSCSLASAQTTVILGAYDTNLDGRFGLQLDANEIFNYLNTGSPSPLHAPGRPSFDVSSTLVDAGERPGPADRVITSLDVLVMVNFVNARSYHQNPVIRQDVNASGIVTALDALLIINYINANTSRGFLDSAPPISNIAYNNPLYTALGYPYSLYWDLKPVAGTPDPLYLDVNGDGNVTSTDADDVIFKLNNPSAP